MIKAILGQVSTTTNPAMGGEVGGQVTYKKDWGWVILKSNVLLPGVWEYEVKPCANHANILDTWLMVVVGLS